MLAAGIRFLASVPQQVPQTFDEAYNYINAVTLVEGRGFVEDFIWNYLEPPDDIPHPGNLYWMPLTGIIAAAGMLLLGLGYSSAQSGFILLSALLPPAGYLIAWQTTGNARHAWIVALLMLFSGYYFGRWTTIESFTPFALAGMLMLWSTARSLDTQRIGWALLAGAAAGLAHLARADGPLLLVVAGLALIARTLSAAPAEGARLSPSRALSLLAALVAAYLIVMLPWFLRNLQVIGAPLAPGGGKTIWLQSYDDIFSYARSIDARTYFDWGPGPILASKLWALQTNLQRLLGEQGLIFALPLAVVGWWRLRKETLFRVVLLYGVLLFIAFTFVFTFPGPRGSWFHSAGVLLPFIFTAAVVGLDDVLEFIGRWRPGWSEPGARNFFSAWLVGMAVILTLLIYVPTARTSAQPPRPAYGEIADLLRGKDATVMIGDPPAYLYLGGYRAVVVPNEPLEVLLDVAERYGAAYLVLDADHPLPLRAVYESPSSWSSLRLEQTFDDAEGPVYLFRIFPP